MFALAERVWLRGRIFNLQLVEDILMARDQDVRLQETWSHCYCFSQGASSCAGHETAAETDRARGAAKHQILKVWESNSRFLQKWT